MPTARSRRPAKIIVVDQPHSGLRLRGAEGGSTAISAAFTLFAMRRGVFIVGDADRQSFRRDLVAFPGLIARFVAFVVAGLWRGVWRLFANCTLGAGRRRHI